MSAGQLRAVALEPRRVVGMRLRDGAAVRVEHVEPGEQRPRRYGWAMSMPVSSSATVTPRPSKPGSRTARVAAGARRRPAAQLDAESEAG